MEIIEKIYGQVVGKASHYQAVPDKDGGRRIIKDKAIRDYEELFMRQCRLYRDRRISSRFKLFVRVYHSSVRYDLDNSLKTLLDCLQMAGAITDDNLCFKIDAEKFIDKCRPRIEFAIVEEHEQKKMF